MSTHDDREVFVDALDRAGQISDHRHVGGVAALERDQVGLKAMDMLDDVDAGDSKVGEFA